jgi:hypothetical protein
MLGWGRQDAGAPKDGMMPKKLIEVALPLGAINVASAGEKKPL